MAKKEKDKVEEIKDKDAKAQALKLALERLEKSFGKGTVMRLG
ncbi:MAG: DNA recombination/repair protein RecA, partial [Capnocytophaga sp.]|nr:DNA recombination/repair protein RecA [Capnocytophaga sp.]